MRHAFVWANGEWRWSGSFSDPELTEEWLTVLSGMGYEAEFVAW